MLACVISFFLCFSLLARLFISSFIHLHGFFFVLFNCCLFIYKKKQRPQPCFLLSIGSCFQIRRKSQDEISP